MRILSLLALLAASAAAQHPGQPHQKWLNEDVTYIITDQEGSAFRQLTTDEQHLTFIEAFWRKRDSNPATVANEFKEEHYRRIVYANQRFAAGIPGWTTDRGRVYITFGPPAQVESRVASGNQPAFEAWGYPKLEGIGEDVVIEFVDGTHTSEYRMTLDPNEKRSSLRRGSAAQNDAEKIQRLRSRFSR